MNQLEQWASETRQAANNPEHEWDKLAIHWPGLNEQSIVFEIGSYKGRWALQMAERYNPELYCFEPQGWACNVTKHVLQKYNAHVFNYGLGVENAIMPMGEFETDGCSFLRDTRRHGVGEIRDIVEFIASFDIPVIDVCLINIEGYEYELVPYMLANEIKPKNLMIQFHGEALQDLVLRKLIGLDYVNVWDFGQTLACWKLK